MYQLEMTEVKDAQGSHENWHYQGYLNLKMKARPKSLAKTLNYDFCGIEMSACSTAGKAALQKYVMKDETRQDGPWSDQPTLAHDDIKVIKDAPYPYQKTILDEVKGRPHHRILNWVIDSKGNQGKSSFAKYVVVNKVGLSLTYGKTSDILNLVSKFDKQRFYLFDLSRTKPKDIDSNDVYATLESIKNGYFINTKYETGVWINDPSHVWVFCNHPPATERMSKDRWQVWSLTETHALAPYVAPIVIED